MTKSSPEQNYKKAFSIAKKISDEMKWIYANYQILKFSSADDIKNKFIGTFAGNAWQTLRRTILNEILISIFRISLDNDNRVASLPRLSILLKDSETLKLVRKNYTQNLSAYNGRIKLLINELELLSHEANDKNSKLKALMLHRHHYTAHAALEPYSGTNKLVWGDQELFVKRLEKIVSVMEEVFLNGVNISKSVEEGYKTYAEDLWSSFAPKK